jgi:pyruvate, water dikinase
MQRADQFILQFNEIGIEDVPLVGGKNASLGEMYQKLTKKKVNIPNGFAVTAQAYRYFLQEEHLNKKIQSLSKKINPKSMHSLAQGGHAIRACILKAELPPHLRIAIINAYRKLTQNDHPDVAVRSSATAEDGPTASFAGQQETFLNIRGEKQLLLACKKCFDPT